MVAKSTMKQELLLLLEDVCGIDKSEINLAESDLFEDRRINAAELALIISRLINKYEVDVSAVKKLPSKVSLDTLIDCFFDSVTTE